MGGTPWNGLRREWYGRLLRKPFIVGKPSVAVILECGGLTPLSFFPSFSLASEFPKKEGKKAASNRRTPKCES